MSPTAPPWSRWTIAHAGVVTVGLALVPVTGRAWSVVAPGAVSLLIFTARHGQPSWANAMTLARLALLVLGAALTDLPQVLSLTLAWALDGLDGALARRRNEVTAFGGHLDMETDALFVATLGALLITRGVLGPWGVFYGLIRSVYVLARAARPGAPQAERRSTWGRWIFSATVVCLLGGLALGPGLPSQVLGLVAAGALTFSFAPDYRALGGTKGAP